MRGVSEVIAIILILMITISLAGLAYMFMSTTMSDVTSSAGSTVDTTTSSMLTSFKIESIDIAKVYVRNTGQNTITSLSVYVNNEPATYNVTTPIAAGAVGTITIYSFIPDGATVKITSPSGFSASKVAQPCDKAVGCWKFDEGSGTVAYDNSPNGNTGTISGATWTSGKYSGALRFDGSNDYVQIDTNLTGSSSLTMMGWWHPVEYFSQGSFSGGLITSLLPDSYEFHLGQEWGNVVFFVDGNDDNLNVASDGSFQSSQNRWQLLVGVLDGSTIRIYVDGVLSGSFSDSTVGTTVSADAFRIGYGHIKYFNGTIDEVRIYDRAIY